MNIEGVIHDIYPMVVKSKRFRKQEFILVKSGQFPQYIKLQCVNRKTSLLNNRRIGHKVRVSVSIEGRKYIRNGEPQYYNFINAEAITLITE